MRHKVLALVAAVAAAMTLTALVAAHTGQITVRQTCASGNIIHASLDANVAEDALWTVRIRSVVINIGNGPGPADLGNFDGGFEAGYATLTITFRQESNTYRVDFGEVESCPSEPPSGSPPPSEIPTPTLSEPPRTQRPTLPPTDTE